MVKKIALRPKMNHYICINESGLTALGDRYKLHVAVTVQSSIKNTSLSTHLIYDGPLTDYIRQLQDLGCTIIQHELSFKGRLRDACKKNSVNFNVASGAFLRLDIPLLDHGNGYAIYTDVDVMFRSDPDLSELTPDIMAAAPEMNIENYDHINSGVLLINLPGLRKELPAFIDRIIDGGMKTSSGDPYDQGHINDFFRGRLHRLDPHLNWKPYWGFNDKASIVHWHGVKYPAAKAISLGLEKTITNYHPHPEIYRRSPSGYLAYMNEYEDIVRTLPEVLRNDMRTNNLTRPSAPASSRSSVDIFQVLGASHTLRWQWHRRDEVVPGLLPAQRFFGLGGAPVWSRTLFDQAAATLGDNGHLVLLVPDFRFGNGIELDAAASAGPLLQDGFLGITPGAITSEHDRIMLERGMAGLRLWHDRFGARAHYVFWCLFGRQVHDRMAGKHIAEGRYHHPVFNYEEIIAALPGLDIADLSPLLRRPMHDVRRLFIDTSSHPSQVGYLLLNGLLFDGLEANAAYDRAVATVEADLIDFAQKIRGRAGKPVLLTGRSVWLDVLMSTLGSTGAAKLAEAGLVLIPIDRSPGQRPLAEILQQHPLASCQPVVISAGGADLSVQLDLLFGNPPSFWRGQPMIDWESATEAAIRHRGETPRFTRIASHLPTAPGAIRLDLPTHAVEQGPLGMPSWTGIVAVLQALTELPTRPAYRIEGDVLVTRNDVAFLIGGNHAVLKFATAELTPTVESLTAFRDNVASRVGRTQAAGIPYIAVIFPDKQSVLSDDFPFSPLHRLGDIYMARLDPALKPYVLWPADSLKIETETPFLPLDTHLTDHGSLAVLRMMLQATKIEADAALERIGSRIVRLQRWKGDLGSKLNPPLFQDSVMLDPDWPQRHFRSHGGFNEGMVDIVLNPEAPVDKTVLLFGDSFFRMMLSHLGAVFTRVICLRTRFLHPEMITLIRPDVIFTGNAERYLSNVISDTEAHAFALYPHLQQVEDLAIRGEFLMAWAAVTAPDAQRSKQFLSDCGFRPDPAMEPETIPIGTTL